jgi:copper chaperone CopZ
MTKKKYKVKGMHCTACVLMIESELEDIGVKSKCSFVKEILVVEFDPNKISEEKIKQTVKSTGCYLS